MTEGLVFIRSSCRELVPSVDTNLVASLCSLFKALFTSQKGASFSAVHFIIVILCYLFIYFIYYCSNAFSDPAESPHSCEFNFRLQLHMVYWRKHGPRLTRDILLIITYTFIIHSCLFSLILIKLSMDSEGRHLRIW